MRSSLTTAYNTNAACSYSLGQVGMGDDDTDFIGNVLDTEPSSVLDPIADTIGTYTPTFTGSSFVNPLPNLNTRGEGNDITLNTIQTVECRIDGGAWTATTPADGLFDGPGEAWTFTTGSLTETTHIVETRAINSVTNAELVFPADTFYVPDALAPAPVTSVASVATDSVVTLTWTNPADADFVHTVIRYSTVSAPATVLDGTALATRATAPAESDTFAHTGLQPDLVYYYSFFTADEVPNYGTVVSVTGAPLYPPPPALLSPAPDSLYVKTDAIFTWDPVTLPDPADTLIAYGLQVATDAEFSTLVFDGDATSGAPADTFWSATGLANGSNYYWRMRGKDLLTNTYGYWSAARAFSTELPVAAVAFLDSTESDYTTFRTGEVVPALQDAKIEARVSPSDTLGIGGHVVQVHWTNGPIADSLALTLDRAESDFSYWRGDVPFGVAFEIGDTVSFWLSAKDPHGTPVTDKNGGQNFAFIAARNPVAAYHVPSSAEPGAQTMRYPFYVTDTDPSFAISIGASPAGSMSAGEVVYQVLNDTLFAAAPLLFSTTVGDTDYYEATIDSSFAFNTEIVYYARAWGDSTHDTTFVHSDVTGSAVTLDPAMALSNAFPLLIQSATGVDGADDPIPAIPVANELARNEPNPFNPTTAIRFALRSEGIVRLHIFDVSGRLVRTLVDESMMPGNHVARWDGLSETGGESASGVYLYRIETAGWSDTRRMILIR
ncbi:MAG: T9SS type A sorting domain-containing protein [Gemmatimonadetes bacterium]|nr:T9SS type A sorting domain-containing protein [Gemmatimonadota bacterium]